jgi:hypothetical protein
MSDLQRVVVNKGDLERTKRWLARGIERAEQGLPAPGCMICVEAAHDILSVALEHADVVPEPDPVVFGEGGTK